jgi:hypothetical protein
MKASMNTQHPPTPPCPSTDPTTLFATTTFNYFEKPIPHQGVMNTQQEVNSAPPQIGK